MVEIIDKTNLIRKIVTPKFLINILKFALPSLWKAFITMLKWKSTVKNNKNFFMTIISI